MPNSQQLLALTKTDLDRQSPEQLLAPAKVVSLPDAHLVKAALYLKLGCLEECHRLAQQYPTPTGNYWHGIMHRHEGDISNSKYWYARVGRHPVLDAIGGYPKNAEAEAREFALLLEYTIRAATGTSDDSE
ncbi:MAG: hypothetical protein PCFJNLEI_02525 [Verrucomicrobiae bacterium]|nr:hypothetical protein [Verrucomicrobiae bacterium]